MPCMSAQTQTNRAPAGYKRRCCEKAVLGIGVRQVSGTKVVEKLSPQTAGKVIYFFYPGLQNEGHFKWMIPGDTQCSGSAVAAKAEIYDTCAKSASKKVWASPEKEGSR